MFRRLAVFASTIALLAGTLVGLTPVASQAASPQTLCQGAVSPCADVYTVTYPNNVNYIYVVNAISDPTAKADLTADINWWNNNVFYANAPTYPNIFTVPYLYELDQPGATCTYYPGIGAGNGVEDFCQHNGGFINVDTYPASPPQPIVGQGNAYAGTEAWRTGSNFLQGSVSELTFGSAGTSCEQGSIFHELLLSLGQPEFESSSDPGGSSAENNPLNHACTPNSFDINQIASWYAQLH